MTNQLSNSVSNMGSTEKDMGLSKILSALAEAVHKTEELRLFIMPLFAFSLIFYKHGSKSIAYTVVSIITISK